MRKEKVVYILFAAIIVLAVMFGSGCSTSASKYSEEEHIQRVKERVEKRYMGEDSEYTGYEVFPLYNEHDELKFFVVEFAPSGYVYVKINEVGYIGISVTGMYSRSPDESRPWSHYTIKGLYENEYGTKRPDEAYEVDENGDKVEYTDSHYKVANISDEKRYLLRVKYFYGKGYIPAVKRGEKYLNLVSMEEFDFVAIDKMTAEDEESAKLNVVSNVSFFAGSILNL